MSLGKTSAVAYQISAADGAALARSIEDGSFPEPNSGCYLWIKCRDKNGYGRFKYAGHVRFAHRLAWLASNGELPAGGVVCHKCDNPSCVNVDHMFIGTHQDNVSDMCAKGRVASGKKQGTHTRPESRSIGIRNGCAKLTDYAIIEIRRDTRSQRAIARDYGVAQSVISRVQRREAWKHVA